MNPLLLSRRRTLQMLDSALAIGQNRFARLAALNWLAAYPGDLGMSLAYARALVGERRLDTAAGILQGLRRADPEYLEAVELLAQVEQSAHRAVSASVAAHLFALTGRSRERRTLAIWAGSLWLARQALQEGKPGLTEEMLRDVLRSAPGEPLAQVTHLAYLRSTPGCDAHAGREIALGYHRASPDCLAVMLHLADWSLQMGEEEYAVALLHQVAARDVGAQTARRIWGAHHPYRALWPETLELTLNLSIPGEVSAALGWNRLSAGGSASAQTDEAKPAPESLAPPQDSPTQASPIQALERPPLAGDFNPVLSEQPSIEDTRPTSVRRAAPQPVAVPVVESKAASIAPDLDISWAMAAEDAAMPSDGAQVDGRVLADACSAADSGDEDTLSADPRTLWQPVESAAATARARLQALMGGERGERRKRRPPQTRKPLEPELRQVTRDLDAAGRRVKLTGLARRDGRFPVYVIFSLRSRLEAYYGAGVAALLESEMEALAQVVGRRRGWNARLFLADVTASLTPLGLEPVCSGDPWELKLALADLDAALARRGECIGALLIVGGPEIVPFHHLPNPVDDQDADVPSDNPYATRTEDYFLPEWPVGRLPGGAGLDARLLLDNLRRIRDRHAYAENGPAWLRRLLVWLRSWLRGGAAARLSPLGAVSVVEWDQPVAPVALGLFSRQPAAFGYTAAVWKSAASKVFTALGGAKGLHVSPPLGFDSSHNPTGRDARLPGVSGRLGYFNLHGVVDAPEWFGQRDPLDASGAPDFPVALRPQDVLRAQHDDAERARDEIPTLVFTQACYGLHIAGRQPEHSLALSFLSAGSMAVAGCTCMSYGAISLPLAAGDLLAHTFWRQIRQGQTAGEALRQAKLHLAAEMVARQGALDGEDQKTLISFVLYGDPLTTVAPARRLPRPVRYQDSQPFDAPTVCDRAVGNETGDPLSSELLSTVRKVVARSLPGMADARLTFSHPRPSCSGGEHNCPTSQLDHAHEQPVQAAHPERRASRLPPQAASFAKTHPQNKTPNFDSCCLVTLSKPITLAGSEHPCVARLTLDEHGQLVKLVVSR